MEYNLYENHSHNKGVTINAFCKICLKMRKDKNTEASRTNPLLSKVFFTCQGHRAAKYKRFWNPMGVSSGPQGNQGNNCHKWMQVSPQKALRFQPYFLLMTWSCQQIIYEECLQKLLDITGAFGRKFDLAFSSKKSSGLVSWWHPSAKVWHMEGSKVINQMEGHEMSVEVDEYDA